MNDDSFELLGRDFSPTREQISLHGLGFIQVKLPDPIRFAQNAGQIAQHMQSTGIRRMHIWHPDLPRRRCYEWSAIHNHRFSFRSTVLVGTQINRRFNVIEGLQLDAGTHCRISHDGARSEKGGRLSYVADGALVSALPDETYQAGESYEMPVLQYHETPNSGVVVTILEKLLEGAVHASTLIDRNAPIEFDQEFDRFQLEEPRLWAFVTDALKAAP